MEIWCWNFWGGSAATHALKCFSEYHKPAKAQTGRGIESGSLVSIVEPSGSGQTTLLNILGCMDIPTAGTYICDRTKVSALKGHGVEKFRKENISFVFQQFALLDDYTVYENVELPLRVKNLSKKERKQRVHMMHELYRTTRGKNIVPFLLVFVLFPYFAYQTYITTNLYSRYKDPLPRMSGKDMFGNWQKDETENYLIAAASGSGHIYAYIECLNIPGDLKINIFSDKAIKKIQKRNRIFVHNYALMFLPFR